METILDTVLGKRKDTEPSRSQFAEKEEEQWEKDLADALSKYKCDACLQVGHSPVNCPTKRYGSVDIDVVGPQYILVCYHCAEYKFNSDKCCVECGSMLKRICGKFCGICNARLDHLSGDCPFKEVNNGGYVPASVRAEVMNNKMKKKKNNKR